MPAVTVGHATIRRSRGRPPCAPVRSSAGERKRTGAGTAGRPGLHRHRRRPGDRAGDGARDGAPRRTGGGDRGRRRDRRRGDRRQGRAPRRGVGLRPLRRGRRGRCPAADGDRRRALRRHRRPPQQRRPARHAADRPAPARPPADGGLGSHVRRERARAVAVHEARRPVPARVALPGDRERGVGVELHGLGGRGRLRTDQGRGDAADPDGGPRLPSVRDPRQLLLPGRGRHRDDPGRVRRVTRSGAGATRARGAAPDA